jgi:hypothetical protein
MKGYRLLFAIALMTLSKNAAGQEYTATLDSTGTEEAVPKSLVRKFQHLTASKGDSLISNVFWATGMKYGTRLYSALFDYQLANGTAVQSSLHFEWNDSMKDFSVSERNMPVGTDTLPRRIRRVLRGKIRRHCRKYAKEVAYVTGYCQFANDHVSVVRCEVHLLDKEPRRSHKTDAQVRSFTIRADGSIRKHFGFR